MNEQTRHKIRSRARGSLWRVQELAARPTVRWRILPDYLVVGAQRCGTTSLQDLLSGHPQVVPPRWRKGIHYFDTDYQLGPDWYRSHFPWRRSTNGGRITGEASPYYLFHPAVPQRIFDLVPDAKIIASLRDPVERAVSHHKHEVRRGFETLDLGDALKAEAERIEGEAERLMTDRGATSYNHQHYSYISRGRYAEQIARYLDLFPKDNVLILEAETTWRDPAGTLREILRFLELEPWSPKYTPRTNATEASSIPDEVRDYLQEKFRPSNRDLESLLGRSFSWT